MAKVKICETVLRDAHQSLVATRMTMDQMAPILEQMDKVGYYSLEGKILYADTEIEDYLKENYHPPYR